MIVVSLLSSKLSWKQWLPELSILSIVFAITSVVVLIANYTVRASKYDHLSDVPIVNPAKSSYFSREMGRRQFVHSSKQILALGRKLFPSKPFRMLTDWGEILILPPNLAHEIRNDPRLSFGLAAMEDNHAHIPGFQPVGIVGREDQLIQIVARKQLTQHLSAVIAPLSTETEYALELNFGSGKDWQEFGLKKTVLDIIARISSRIYLGSQLCRNDEWLRITKNYTTAFFIASTELRMWPRPLRPIAHWFIPSCGVMRKEHTNARRVINALIERREKLKQDCIANGRPAPRMNDALTWAEQEAALKKATFDPATFQLTLALLAIHTTYDLLEQCMLDLGANPQYAEPLREEILAVLKTDGWTKNALYKMKLLDSAIKESQRLKPGSIASMRRFVKEDMTLPNGIALKKGSRLSVDGYRMSDPELHNEPEVYRPFRFYEMRSQPGGEHMAQLSATSVDHLGFGHGEHSCPGRFFAANEIKIALCHLIIKYEWKLAPDTSITPNTKGMVSKASPSATILVRKRDNIELDIDAI